MIDNYDSFVYNLVRYFEELNEKVILYRNDEITIDMVKTLNPIGIIISPGPKSPKESGNTLEIVDTFKDNIPMLGICLGHQSIAYAFGGEIVHGNRPMHGKISKVYHNEQGIFEGLPQGFLVTRYHSLVVDRKTLPECLAITCKSDDGEIMGIRHKNYMVEGVQFHPEAELTQYGHAIIERFIKRCKEEFNSDRIQ